MTEALTAEWIEAKSGGEGARDGSPKLFFERNLRYFSYGGGVPGGGEGPEGHFVIQSP
jgi:hypothetical protein